MNQTERQQLIDTARQVADPSGMVEALATQLELTMLDLDDAREDAQTERRLRKYDVESLKVAALAAVDLERIKLEEEGRIGAETVRRLKAKIAELESR